MKLFPEIQAFKKAFYDTKQGHKVYYELSGNPDGFPILYLHGGPGSGTQAKNRRLFDPKKFKIILIDQRGCGQSTPHASVENNTTWDLIDDLEGIRNELNISKWDVLGGSWGALLGLAYAIKHPESIRRLIVRSIYLGRKTDTDWIYKKGASEIFPEAWQDFINFLETTDKQNEILNSYHSILHGPDCPKKFAAAQSWAKWEGSIYKLEPMKLEGELPPDFALSFAKIESHYFKNGCFLKTDNWILENAHKLESSDLSVDIIQGRYDICTPFEAAFKLKEQLPRARFSEVTLAGHSGSEEQMQNKILKVVNG